MPVFFVRISCSIGIFLTSLYLPFLVCTAHAWDSDTGIQCKKIYDAEFSNAPSGFYIHGDYFFAIATIEAKENESGNMLQVRARRAANRCIEQWYRDKIKDQIGLDRPDASPLEKNIYEYITHGTSTLTINSLAVSAVANWPTATGYKHAIAGLLADLEKSIQYTSTLDINHDETVMEYLQYLVENKDHARLAQYAMESGEDFIAVLFTAMELEKTYFLKNYAQNTNSIIQRRRDAVIYNDASLAKEYSLLSVCPANPVIMQSLHDSFQEKSLEQHCIATLSHAAFPSKWSYNSMRAYMDKTPSRFLQDTPSPQAVPTKYILGMVLASGGAFLMDESISKEDSPELQEAQTLFAQQGDLGRVHELLVRAIERVPANILAWDYVGAVYKEQENWRDCAAIYRQMMMLDPWNAAAFALYAESLEHLGFTLEAKRVAMLAWALRNKDTTAEIDAILQRLLGHSVCASPESV